MIDKPSCILSPSKAKTGFSQGWIWWLPLLFVTVPAWMAWRYTCMVPKMDLWEVVARPYLNYKTNGDFAAYLHSPGNDSRHDAPKFIHWLLVEFTNWNLVIESLVCVFFGAVICAMTISLWRAHPVTLPVRWGLSLFSTMLLLSPMQWMNWAWGVQICYMLVIAATLAVVWFFQRPWPLLWQTLAAGTCAALAVFSFINGWIAWVLGGAAIAAVFVKKNQPPKQAWWAVILWVGMFAATLWLFLKGWPEGKPLGVVNNAAHFIKPGELAVFFLHLTGAPFAEGWPTLDRDVRAHLLYTVSTGMAVLSFSLLAFALWQIWKKRRDLDFASMLPWLLLCIWGLANTAAITAARIGMENYQPFHSRYPAYTLWFHIGLLGLLAMLRGSLGKWLLSGWVVLAAWGWFVGAVQGWRDAVRISHNSHLLESAAALRHVAPEPKYLDALDPGGGSEVTANLDRLDALNLLLVTTIEETAVTAAQVAPPGTYLGQLTECRSMGGEVEIKGWAVNKATLDAAKAVVISVKVEGKPERWFGLATRRPRERAVAKKLSTKALEDRIGWTFEPMGKDISAYSKRPYALQRNTLPRGEVVFKAYAFEPQSGIFYPLEGTAILNLP